MVIPLIEQGHLNIPDSAKPLRRVDACEATSHDDDPLHRFLLRDIMPFMIRNADTTDLPAIVDIYNAAIPGRLATADTEPVSLESRQSWIQDRDFSRH